MRIQSYKFSELKSFVCYVLKKKLARLPLGLPFQSMPSRAMQMSAPQERRQGWGPVWGEAVLPSASHGSCRKVPEGSSPVLPTRWVQLSPSRPLLVPLGKGVSESTKTPHDSKPWRKTLWERALWALWQGRCSRSHSRDPPQPLGRPRWSRYFPCLLQLVRIFPVFISARKLFHPIFYLPPVEEGEGVAILHGSSCHPTPPFF